MSTIVRIGPKKRKQYQDQLRALEAKISYPLGDDRFTIDHGDDYFAFFDRLGEVHFFGALADDTLVAVGCGILREVPRADRKATQRVWYLCDLKADSAHKGGNFAARMLAKGIFPGILRSRKAYLISMNPPCKPNKLVRLVNKNKFVRFEASTQLLIYSLEFSSMNLIRPTLEALLGSVKYLSLEGIKDLKMHSTGKRYPLLHMQWGTPCEKPGGADSLLDTPQNGFQHMFCAPETSALAKLMQEHNVPVNATATIISYGTECLNFDFVRTSDI